MKEQLVGAAFALTVLAAGVRSVPRRMAAAERSGSTAARSRNRRDRTGRRRHRRRRSRGGGIASSSGDAGVWAGGTAIAWSRAGVRDRRPWLAALMATSRPWPSVRSSRAPQATTAVTGQPGRTPRWNRRRSMELGWRHLPPGHRLVILRSASLS